MTSEQLVHVEAAPMPAQSDEVTSLVQLAVERGVDVAVLRDLVALKERVEERSARAAFFEALIAFRAKCPPIPKTRENSQFRVTRAGIQQNAKYAALEDIDRVARPIAAEVGLVWTWDTRVEGDLMHITCRVLHIMGHSESSTVSMPYESKAGASPQQKYGSTQTYGMRYSLIAALGLTTADEDGDGASGRTEPEHITEQEAADLDALIDDVGADRVKFCRYFKIGLVMELPQKDLPRAIRQLETRRNRS